MFPHVRRFVVFTQLLNGLGDVPVFFEIRRAADDELIRTTAERTIRFTDRVATKQVAMTLDGVMFPTPGIYVVSLFCHNTWVCDTTVSLD